MAPVVSPVSSARRPAVMGPCRRSRSSDSRSVGVIPARAAIVALSRADRPPISDNCSRSASRAAGSATGAGLDTAALLHYDLRSLAIEIMTKSARSYHMSRLAPIRKPRDPRQLKEHTMIAMHDLTQNQPFGATAADEAAVRDLFAELLAAWGRGDGQAYGAL